MSQRLFIFAGEKSGDLLGSYLLKELSCKLPQYSIEGVGGPEMRREGLDCLMRTEEFEIMGFSEVLKSLLKLRRQFCSLRHHILETKPKAVILIDYPGFNLKMAKSLRKRGFRGKIIQYISPTVWAWGKKRVQTMENTLDLLMTIYPFEHTSFKNSSLHVKYVGNPIKEIVGKHCYDDDWTTLFGIKEPENMVAIFPGSRQGEIQLNLPKQLKAAELMKKEDPSIRFCISCAHEKIMPLMHRIMKDISLKFNEDVYFLPKNYAYEMMRDCRAAIAKSGTVTLELALHKCPTVVVYKLTALNRFIAQYAMRLKLPHYCIVNILANKTVFPELIEKRMHALNIFQYLKQLFYATEERKNCIQECEKLPQILEESSASSAAASFIRELLL